MDYSRSCEERDLGWFIFLCFLSVVFWHDSAEMTSFFVPFDYNRNMEGKNGSIDLHRYIVYYKLGDE